MQYYHGTTERGLGCLRPGKPAYWDKPSCVYLTSLYPMRPMCIAAVPIP